MYFQCILTNSVGSALVPRLKEHIEEGCDITEAGGGSAVRISD